MNDEDVETKVYYIPNKSKRVGIKLELLGALKIAKAMLLLTIAF